MNDWFWQIHVDMNVKSGFLREKFLWKKVVDTVNLFKYSPNIIWISSQVCHLETKFNSGLWFSFSCVHDDCGNCQSCLKKPSNQLRASVKLLIGSTLIKKLPRKINGEAQRESKENVFENTKVDSLLHSLLAVNKWAANSIVSETTPMMKSI